MILVLAALFLADDGAIDAERAAWQFKRQVKVKGSAGLSSLTLPPELSVKAGPSGRDFRLVDETGRETPYLLDWTSERIGLATWRASVKDLRRETEDAREASAVRSQWTLDLGEERAFTDVAVDVPDVAFAWHVRLETSVDGSHYEVVEADASLFDQAWNGERVRKTDIRFDAPLTARYLRLTARSASGSRSLELGGASVTLRRRLAGDGWSMDGNAEAVPESGQPRPNTTRYRLNASSLLPFNEVEVVTDDGAFSRRIRLIEEVESGGRKAQTLLGEASIFRVSANDALIKGESVRLPTRNGRGGVLFLEIDNAGSPPLRGLRARLHGSRIRLLFPASIPTLWLYYGNEATRAPAYDLEGLRPQLTQALRSVEATMGSEERNEAFKREPPLRFAAVAGASLEASRWRFERVLLPIREEDVYALTLKATDLARLTPSLADLRIVDGQNRQVPFLIDRAFTDERIALKVERARASPTSRSLYSITPSLPVAGDEAPPVERIELEVADSFFERPARFLHPKNQSQREAPFSISLARRPPSSSPLQLKSDAPLGTMTLEVDDGDNAPLDIRSATGIVRVPRVVFKAAPGDLRLLLGNRAAEAPRYDLASLRSELLAYSAVAATSGALTETQGGRMSRWSRMETAPRAALVWTAIIAAIVALVALTLRTLRNV